jgi:hypothetical protein
MRILPLFLAALLAASPVVAAEHGGGHEGGEKKEGKEGEGKKGAPGNNVENPFVMAPMTDADGKLTGYAYISSITVATNQSAALAIREKLAFLQDAFIRNVNAAPVSDPHEPGHVDVPAVQTRLTADAKKIMGAQVKSVLVCSIQISELHPKQTPDLHTPPKEAIPHSGKEGEHAKKSPCDS